MLLITTEALGRPAFARMRREGALLPYGPGVGRVADIPDTLALRALSARLRAHRDDAVTGLGALWLLGSREEPPAVWHTLAGPSVRDKPRAHAVRHASGYEGQAAGPLRVAALARAGVDALRWEAPAESLPAVHALIAARIVDAAALDAVVTRMPRGPERRRVTNLVAALAAAAQDRRLVPVTRRAS